MDRSDGTMEQNTWVRCPLCFNKTWTKIWDDTNW